MSRRIYFPFENCYFPLIFEAKMNTKVLLSSQFLHFLSYFSKAYSCYQQVINRLSTPLKADFRLYLCGFCRFRALARDTALITNLLSTYSLLLSAVFDIRCRRDTCGRRWKSRTYGFLLRGSAAGNRAGKGQKRHFGWTARHKGRTVVFKARIHRFASFAALRSSSGTGSIWFSLSCRSVRSRQDRDAISSRLKATPQTGQVKWTFKILTRTWLSSPQIGQAHS